MSESEWTKIVKKALRHKGELLGFDTQSGFEDQITLGNGLKIRPDVLWGKKNRIHFVFEIDRHQSRYYQKTIFGSMFSGIILATSKNAKFVEIVQKGVENSNKASQIAHLFKRYFGKKIYVIEVPKRKGKWKEANMRHFLVMELRHKHIIRY